MAHAMPHSQPERSDEVPERKAGRVAKTCVLWVHGDSFSKQHVIFNASVLPAGSFQDGALYSISNLHQTRNTTEVQDMESLRHRPEKLGTTEEAKFGQVTNSNIGAHGRTGQEYKFLFVGYDMDPDQKNKHPQLQISVSEDIARSFGFANRSNVLIVEEDPSESYASHIEISFRDVYLARGDMWRMASAELNDTAVFEGQKLLFLGTVKAMVKRIYARGRRVRSARFSGVTRLIFRSDAARFVIYIQLSREMWEFDDTSGDIMFNKVIYGFLPELFKRWYDLKVRHLVTIVLFTRVESASAQDNDLSKYGENLSSWQTSRDFYRVVTSDMSSGDWAAILTKLKQDFKIFLRDVSLHPAASGLSPSEKSDYQRQSRNLNDATNGNILEAINLASAHFERDYVDRDLARTGLSIIVITPGTGVFRVDESMLQLTTERLINNGIGIDLVCLSRRPLHSVPLFRYTKRNASKQQSANERDENVLNSASRLNYWGNFTDTAFSKSRLALEDSGHPRKIAQTAVSSTLNAVFAVPHWINVSFWSAVPLLPLRHTNENSRDKESNFNFKARCRMYELQMMGFMENEASNISIPYLHEHIRRIETQKYQDFAGQQDHNTRNSFQDKGGTIPSPWQSGKLDTGKVDAHKSQHLSQSQGDGELIVRMEMYDNDIFTPPTPERLENDEENLLGEDVVRDETNDKESISEFRDYGVLKGKISSSSINASAFRSGAATTTLPTTTEEPRHSAKTKEQSRKSLLSLSLAYQKKASAVTGSSATGPTVSSFTYKPTESTSTTQDAYDGTLSQRIRQSLSRTTTSLSAVSAEAFKPITVQDHESQGTTSDSAEPAKANNDTSVTQRQGNSNVAPVLNKASAPRQAPPRDTFGRTFDDHIQYGTTQENSSPWLTLLNPSNPQPESRQRASDYNRWQHVFPYESQVSPIKWESLCSPASLPLTNGYFPTTDQLKNAYTESPYKIAVGDGEDDAEVTRNRQRLVRELIDFRLSRGFQIVTSSETDPAPLASTTTENDIYAPRFMAEVGDIVHLSRGDTIHQIICGDASEIQVTLYKKVSRMDTLMQQLSNQLYEPMVRALTADNYTGRALRFSLPEEDYNWNYVDNFLAGYHPGDIERLRSWRSRFVLLPMELSTYPRRGLSTLPEDSEEETRIEGLRKLTQLWQRFRHIPPEERRYHTSLNLKKDPNPLKLEFQTRDPSVVVTLGFDNTLLNEGETGAAGHLFASESDLYKTSSFDLHKLAGDVQGEKGIRVQNRRWHWKIHLASFVGADFTTWLLANFADIESREEAVDLGNVLMEKGLFQHVSKKHKFRDGHFFYTFTEDYLLARPESRMSWFGSTKRVDRSYPGISTPDISRDISSPDPRRKQDLSEDVTGPAASGKPFVSLSSKIAYDVDHRKRSDRPEVIDLHYDRLHNPGNAFHLQLVWSRATGGLIEESVANWSMLAERHGLRLVQVPIFEASSLSHVHPFREPHPIRLALLPPGFDPSESTQIMSPRLGLSDDRYMYHKEILKKLNYVLDVEAATNFPSDVEVTFSWGKPDYRASQYIHKSGLLLMQVSADGRFLLVANRLCNNRILARDSTKFEKGDGVERRAPQSREGARHSPFASPAFKAVQDGSPVAPLFAGNESLQMTAAQLKDEFEAFCYSKDRLRAFYEETSKSAESAISTSSILPSEASIPKFGLPPPLEFREYPVIATSRQSSASKASTSLAGMKSPGRPEPTRAQTDFT